MTKKIHSNFHFHIMYHASSHTSKRGVMGWRYMGQMFSLFHLKLSYTVLYCTVLYFTVVLYVLRHSWRIT